MAHPAREFVMLMTIDEFLSLPNREMKEELVRGELRVNPPPGAPHGVCGANLVTRLIEYVAPRKLGRVFGDGFGYQLTRIPHTVRVPDASFVSAARWPVQPVGRGIVQFAPDIAVEVLSPSETASDLQEKLDDYNVSGTALVWVVDPVRRTVMVVSRNAPLKQLHESDMLDGGEVLPDFSCKVSDIFDGVARDLG